MDKKGKKALTNYLYNNKFPIFLRSQPLDNLFIKSLLPKLKRERAVLLSLPPTKKIKIKNQKIIIDNISSLNYIIKNDSKINQYVNYLIDKGIIIQQKNSSENFLFKKVNEFTGNMIEKIDYFEILKLKRIYVVQIMAQIFIDKENIANDKIKINEIFKKENIEFLPKEKEPLKNQLINNIIVNGKIKPNFIKEKINDIQIVCKKPNISIIDEGISLCIIGKEKSNLKLIPINSIFVKGQKITNNNIEKNSELQILQKREFIRVIKNLDRFIIKGNEKNEKKNQIYTIDNIINLKIYSEDYEEEEKELKDEINILDVNEINDINNIDIENNDNINIVNEKGTKLRNNNHFFKSYYKKKKDKNKLRSRKNKAPLVIEENEKMFIESAYDMLFVERTWDILDKENINNIFIKGNNINNKINNNIFKKIIKEDPNEVIKEIEINKSIEILSDKDENIIHEEIVKSQPNKYNKNWNKIIFPKSNGYINILGGKKNLNKNLIRPKNKIINQCKFYIPPSEKENFSINLRSSNNNKNNKRYWTNDIIKYGKEKNFSILRDKNIKKWDDINRIQKQSLFSIIGKVPSSNIINNNLNNNNFIINKNINNNKISNKVYFSINNDNSNKTRLRGKNKNKFNNNSINNFNFYIINSNNDNNKKTNKIEIQNSYGYINNINNTNKIEIQVNNPNKFNNFEKSENKSIKHLFNNKFIQNKNNYLEIEKIEPNNYIKNNNLLVDNGDDDEIEQIINQDDYDYHSNKEKLITFKNKKINRRENKRYSEDIEEHKNGNEFIPKEFLTQRTRTIQKFNHFKSKSNDKTSINSFKRIMRKKDKDFEFLRENDFDQNNY